MALQLQSNTSNPAVPGVAQANGLQLQGSGTNVSSLNAPASMGIQTPSPKVSTSTPPPIVNTVKDLSNQYANVNGTIYNKNTGQGYSDPSSFFKDSGVSSFNNLKFDTNWTPPTSTLGGLQMPGSTQSNQGSGLLAPGSTGGGLLGSTPAQNNSSGYNTSQNPNANTSAYSSDYTSLASGNYGDLVKQSAQLSTPSQQEIDLANNIAALKGTATEAMADTSTVGDLEGATGRQTAISTAANAKIQAMEDQLTNLQNQRNNALAGVNNQINALKPVSAAPGTTLINPATGETVASTTEPITNIAGAPTSFNPSTGLIGQGATGGGILGTSSSGGNDVASVVSSVLTSLGANDQASNSFITSAVQQTIANGGVPPSNLTSQQAQVVQQVLSKMTGGTYSSVQADINQGIQTSQSNQVASYKSALQQGQNLQSQLTDLISRFGLNPNDLNAANAGLQAIAKNTSSPQYQIFSNYINDVANTYAQILTPAGGSQTDTTRSIASSMINATASGSSITDTMKALDEAAQAKIAGVPTTQSSNNTSSSNSSSLFSW